MESNKKYKIKIYPEYSLDGKEVVGDFSGPKSKEELEVFLYENGYEPTEAQVAELIEKGGKYTGLVGSEFELSVEDENPQTEFNNSDLFVKKYKDFLVGKKLQFNEEESDLITDVESNDNAATIILENYEDAIIEPKDFEKFISGESVNEDFQLVIASEEEEEEEEEEEPTKFNDSDLFVKEFEKYLVGKTIKIQGAKATILTVLVADNNEVFIDAGEYNFNVDSKDFQKFIDGENVETTQGPDVELVLQEEPVTVSLNKPEYKYYVLNNNKIIGGYEYKEDATYKLEKSKQFGESEVELKSKRELSIDAENPDNWNLNEHDWAIITEVVTEGANKNNYSPKQAELILVGFKESGKYLPVVKSRLISSLREVQNALRDGYKDSNIERIDDKLELSSRIQKELKRIIAMES